MINIYNKIKKSSFFIFLLIICCFLISGCHGLSEDRSLRNLSKEDRHNTHYKGHFKVGKKYKIKGKTYNPTRVVRYSKVGRASWYGSKHGFHGKKTANGDTYNKNLLTAAHRTLPLPSLVRVKNLENGKSLIVMVNDRGPYARNREIDVSEKAATILGFKQQGTAKVRVQYLHNETVKLLHNFDIKSAEGSTAKRPLKNKKCSVNCLVKLVNQKYKLRHG